MSANIWLADMATFGEMNAVWDAWVSPGHTPARATVEAKLAAPDYKVEIMVVAGAERRRQGVRQMAFDFTPLVPPGSPLPAARWASAAEYNFTCRPGGFELEHELVGLVDAGERGELVDACRRSQSRARCSVTEPPAASSAHARPRSSVTAVAMSAPVASWK